MKLVVTGGSGFIGSNFIHHWLGNHQDTIINVDALTYAANPESLTEFRRDPRYVFEHADISDRDRIEAIFAHYKPEVVVNFAAESHVDRALNEPNIFVVTNVLGTQVLLETSLRHGVRRFHHISTDEVFGQLRADSTEQFDENSPYRPRNPYSASKAAADHLVRAYNTSLGLATTVTNCSNNYGPFHTPEKMIPLAITNLAHGKKIPVYGEGKQSRDWLYVADHCRAIEAVLERGEAGDTYCVGGLGEEVNNLELAVKICQLMDKDPDQWIEFVPDRRAHDFRYSVNWSHIASQLKWEPQVSLEQGLAATVAWYQDNEGWWEPIKTRQPHFQRVTN